MTVTSVDCPNPTQINIPSKLMKFLTILATTTVIVLSFTAQAMEKPSAHTQRHTDRQTDRTA